MSNFLYRFQSPTVGSTIRLGFDVYNSNNFADPTAISEVDIYFLDPAARTEINHDGRTLFATIPAAQVVRTDVGQYYTDLLVSPPQFVVGNYLDVWQVQFRSDEPPGEIEQTFAVYPDLWITSPIPIVYDFQFRFTPSRWRKGEIKYLQCEITPLVPRQSDLIRYYANLAIAADVSVTIVQRCGECLPCEEDLRIVVEDQPMTYKEKGVAFWQWDTTEVECGIYDVTAKMVFGNNVYVSEANQVQVFG